MAANFQNVAQGAQQLVRRITRSMTRKQPEDVDNHKQDSAGVKRHHDGEDTDSLSPTEDKLTRMDLAKRPHSPESVFSEAEDLKQSKIDIPKRPPPAESVFSDDEDPKQPRMESQEEN